MPLCGQHIRALTFENALSHGGQADTRGLGQKGSPGLVLVPLFRDGSWSLATVLNYLSNEISLQSTGQLQAEGATLSAAARAGTWAQGLLNVSFSQLTGEAERRFLQVCALALSHGNSILLICDGLEQEQWMMLAELVLHVHQHVATQLWSLRFKGDDGEEAGSIQCLMSATTLPGQFGRPAGDGFVEVGRGGRGMSEAQLGSKEGNKGVLGQARQVELLELTHGERVAIARQVFAELHLQDEESGVGSESKESAAQELAEIIGDKEQAHLPLYVVMAAAQVALFQRSHLRHRQVNSYGQVPRAGTIIPSYHDTMIPTWRRGDVNPSWQPSFVPFYCKCTRALTLENLYQGLSQSLRSSFPAPCRHSGHSSSSRSSSPSSTT